jgi:hypothetical protein
MKSGLYANINAKQKRIAAGSGEKMRKPGSAGAPTAKAFKQSAKQSEHRLALDGWKWRSVVSDIADKLRSALKYDDDLTPETNACLEKLREEVFRLLEDHGLNLYDE